MAADVRVLHSRRAALHRDCGWIGAAAVPRVRAVRVLGRCDLVPELSDVRIHDGTALANGLAHARAYGPVRVHPDFHRIGDRRLLHVETYEIGASAAELRFGPAIPS